MIVHMKCKSFSVATIASQNQIKNKLEMATAQVCIMAGIALQLTDTLAPKIFTKLASSSSPGLLQLHIFLILWPVRCHRAPQGLGPLRLSLVSLLDNPPLPVSKAEAFTLYPPSISNAWKCNPSPIFFIYVGEPNTG